MTKPDYLELKLGGREFRVRPFTLGQLRELGIGAAENGGKVSAAVDAAEIERLGWDRWIAIIHLAVTPEHPDVTPENILALPVRTTKAVVDAVNEILIFSGAQPKEPKPGE